MTNETFAHYTFTVKLQSGHLLTGKGYEAVVDVLEDHLEDILDDAVVALNAKFPKDMQDALWIGWKDETPG